MIKDVQEIGALVMVVIALLVISYAATIGGSEQAEGALIGILAAGTGFFLRGKVESTTRV